MRIRFGFLALALALGLAVGAPASAAGVFIVSHKGVGAFDGAKAGFIQMAYGAQLPGFNPKSVELDGSAGDDAALTALAAQNPALVFAVGGYAAKKVRKSMPDVWIVYGMVYYPEAEGLVQDSKMVGVSSLGSAKGLAVMVKAFTKSKTMVVLHAQAGAASVQAIVDRLVAEGYEVQAKTVPDAAGVQAAFATVKDQCKILVLLPDAVTANQDAMRFLVSQCVAGGILPVSFSESLVSSGVLLAAFYPPEAVGAQAAKLAAELLKTGQAPAERLVNPSESSTALNKGTAQALKLQIPKTLRVEVAYE